MSIGDPLQEWTDRRTNGTSVRRPSWAQTRDHVTRLPGLAVFEAALDRPADRRFALVAIDIVNLVELRRHLGARVAGAALLGTARALCDIVRASDLVARTGERGFGVLVLDAGAADVVAIARRVQAAVESELDTVTIAVGGAAGRPGGDPHAVWALAQRALGRALGERPPLRGPKRRAESAGRDARDPLEAA